jgi:hypothetical protein
VLAQLALLLGHVELERALKRVADGALKRGLGGLGGLPRLVAA